MPPRLWSDQAIDVNQRHSTYVWAADQIVELERENARLQMELDASCNAEEMRQVRAENAVLRSALDQQANYQRDLRADRDRLDWICEHLFTTRAAIDAKLEEEAQP
jgi:hypothetical protein